MRVRAILAEATTPAFRRLADRLRTQLREKAPPGWSGTVKAMKKHSDIDNPFALAWAMHNRGDQSHKAPEKKEATPGSTQMPLQRKGGIAPVAPKASLKADLRRKVALKKVMGR